jgi:hypothetical protein
LLNSSLFYWFWFSISEGYHCGKHEVLDFPVNLDNLSDDIQKQLTNTASKLMKDLKNNSQIRKRAQKTTKVEYQEFYLSKSKPIIDEIDRALARHYGLSDEELDFIINYDVKYRMGSELESEDE